MWCGRGFEIQKYQNYNRNLFSIPVSRRSLEMRVRATDPRPCPKCGKIYRSAHTLRTHLEDKHTVCPGYRCVLCGTVAKSRNSLHSHMSRQHRGISTKDLPVLPMPSPFDPELASRLLAKAGVKISAAELRARASPTGGAQRGGSKLDLRSAGDPDDSDEDADDPEDLTTGGFGSMSSHGGNGFDSRYNESMMGYGHHPNSRLRESGTPKSMDMKDGILPPSAGTGQSLLDTYLQFIADNPFGRSFYFLLYYNFVGKRVGGYYSLGFWIEEKSYNFFSNKLENKIDWIHSMAYAITTFEEFKKVFNKNPHKIVFLKYF